MDTSREVAVPFYALVAAYAIVPLCLAVVLIDLSLGGHLRDLLPRTPDSVFLYTLIFITPHGIAGLFSFADKDYLSFYKRKFSLEIPLLMAVCLFLYLAYPVYAFVLYVLYTQYHGLSQQAGMGRFYFKTKLPEFGAWRWTAILIGVVGYGAAYRNSIFPAEYADRYSLAASIVLFLPLIALAVSMFARINNTQGRKYLLMVVGSLVIEFYMFLMGYPILAIFCTRFVHDIPAFMAYITHDHNRRVHAKENIVYRFISALHIPLYVAAPVLAIAVAYGIAKTPYIAGATLFLIAMLHYYVEGFIWKNGSIHRQYLKFA